MTHSIIRDIPIACSLSASDYRRRVEEAGNLAEQALRARHPIPGGARLTFADHPGLRERLESFVAAESRCCAFLTLDLAGDAGDLVLTVIGPAEAAPIIEDLFA